MREEEEREAPAGWEREVKLVGRWGLGKGELAEYRKVYLRPEYHWKRIGLTVWYSPEGIAVAKKHFEPPEPEELWRRKVAEKRAEVAKWAGPPEWGTPLSERVCRVCKGLRNPRMIRVENMDGKKALIRVRSSRNFREGMLVDLGSCRVMDHEPDGHTMRVSSGMGGPVLYELMIPLPRYEGRWGYDERTVGYIGRSGSYFKRGQAVARIPKEESGAVWWRTQRRVGS
jgi:hypothetical protein